MLRADPLPREQRGGRTSLLHASNCTRDLSLVAAPAPQLPYAPVERPLPPPLCCPLPTCVCPPRHQHDAALGPLAPPRGPLQQISRHRATACYFDHPSARVVAFWQSKRTRQQTPPGVLTQGSHQIREWHCPICWCPTFSQQHLVLAFIKVTKIRGKDQGLRCLVLSIQPRSVDRNRGTSLVVHRKQAAPEPHDRYLGSRLGRKTP